MRKLFFSLGKEHSAGAVRLRIFCCCCNPHKIQFYLTRLFVYLQVEPTRFFLFFVECNRNVI